MSTETPSRVDLLLRNLTVANFTEGRVEVLEDAEIGLLHGKIVRCRRAGAPLEAAAELDLGGRVALPGLINCHMHWYSTFARGIALAADPPENFPQILERLWWWLDRGLTTEDLAASTMPVLIEAIKAGTTTIFDHHSSPRAIPGCLDVLAECVERANLRASLCYEVSDRDGPAAARQGLEENARFLRRCRERGTDWLRGHFGLHAAFTLSDETILRAVELARAAGAGLHIHVAEDRHDQEVSLREHGMRVVQRLARLGVLGPRTIAAHCVQVDRAEAELLAETGAFVAHNPESNMGNAVGIADLELLLDSGVRVGLGTDGCTSRMANSIRLAGNLQRTRTGDPRTFGAGQILELAFHQPARLASETFGVPLGTLDPGAGGDIVVFDYRPPTPLTPENFAGHLLFGITDAPVHTTIARGKVVYHQGKLLTLDEEAVAAEARERAAALWRRLGV
jgi:putative selenium metabolism protein SsnA